MQEHRFHDDRADVGQFEAVPRLSGDRDSYPANRFASQTALDTSNPHHICVVTETYPPEINGVTVTLSRLVSGLRERGNTVSVVHPKPRYNPIAGSSFNFDTRDIQIRGLPLPGYHGLQFGLPAGRLLSEVWSDIPPASVYVATEGPLGLSAVRAAHRLGIPAVSGFHTNFHSYCKHYRVGWLQRVALGYLRWFHNQTELTLVSTEELRVALQSTGFCNVGNLERGVDAERFAPYHRSPELRRE